MDHTVPPIPFRARTGTRAALALLGASLLALGGCSTVENLLSGEKVDYRSATNRPSGLEIPPDLTQLSRDSRYAQVASGSVAASTFQTQGAGMAPIPTNPSVAPQQLGEFRIERLGNERWLATSLPPDAVFPQVRAFWKDNGFSLVQDRPEAGVLETDWAENRARLPNDFIRNTIGKVFDSAFSTSELDKYRTRVERNGTGTDIYVTHRGLAEVYVGERKESTTWQPRPAEPQLEAEFLARLMVKLGGREEQARSMVQTSAAAPAGPARARTVANQPGPTLQVDDGFDRAWRRVGLALDRTGFTVEDRDRGQGLYYVRYVNPRFAGREEPSFFAKLFRFGRKPEDDASAQRYRVKVTGDGAAASTVTVLDPEGKPAAGDSGQRIATLLLDDLK
jgi:outer membrane protein assembly factor BamC